MAAAKKSKLFQRSPWLEFHWARNGTRKVNGVSWPRYRCQKCKYDTIEEDEIKAVHNVEECQER